VSNLIHNERVKLIATSLSGIAVGTFVTMALAAAFVRDPDIHRFWMLLVLMGMAGAAGIVLVGLLVLGELRE
jgi:hypothetical protein